jgi:MFS family permease
LIFADATAVNVALPALERDLHAGPAGAAWVVEAYALTLSALILLGGALGDIFGRRGVYGIGIALFAVASAACAAAPNLGVLIAARCVQGVGGALATPGSLALISAAFDGPARGRAIGTWSAFSVIVSAAGPIVGGWLVQSFSWRWIFLINLPLAAIVLGVLVTRVGESRDPSVARRVDVGGAALATGGLGALVFGLIRCAGSKPGMLGAFALAAGLLLLAGFVAVERRSAAPMLQFALFRSRPFMIANLFTFLVCISFPSISSMSRGTRRPRRAPRSFRRRCSCSDSRGSRAASSTGSERDRCWPAAHLRQRSASPCSRPSAWAAHIGRPSSRGQCFWGLARRHSSRR